MNQFVSVFVTGNVHTQQRWKTEQREPKQTRTSEVRMRTSRFSGALPLRPTLIHGHHSQTHTLARAEGEQHFGVIFAHFVSVL